MFPDSEKAICLAKVKNNLALLCILVCLSSLGALAALNLYWSLTFRHNIHDLESNFTSILEGGQQPLHKLHEKGTNSGGYTFLFSNFSVFQKNFLLEILEILYHRLVFEFLKFFLELAIFPNYKQFK